MGVEFHIVLNTPEKDGVTIKNPTAKQATELLRDGVQQTFAKVAYQEISKSVTVAKDRLLMILATFFDRVVSRTPMDENYVSQSMTSDGEIKYKEHKADGNFVRYDWQITCGEDRIISGDLMDGQIFKTYNSKGDINMLFWLFKEKFGNKKLSELQSIWISNFNDHFATLEYGGYETEDHFSGKGEREHGVANQHSIYAPNGMLRITEMELESIAASTAKTSLSKRYRQQRTNQVLSKGRIDKLINIVMRSGTLSLGDLDTLVGAEDYSIQGGAE